VRAWSSFGGDQGIPKLRYTSPPEAVAASYVEEF
jgi:hypothetical protein